MSYAHTGAIKLPRPLYIKRKPVISLSVKLDSAISHSLTINKMKYIPCQLVATIIALIAVVESYVYPTWGKRNLDS